MKWQIVILIAIGIIPIATVGDYYLIGHHSMYTYLIQNSWESLIAYMGFYIGYFVAEFEYLNRVKK